MLNEYVKRLILERFSFDDDEVILFDFSGFLFSAHSHFFITKKRLIVVLFKLGMPRIKTFYRKDLKLIESHKIGGFVRMVLDHNGKKLTIATSYPNAIILEKELRGP